MAFSKFESLWQLMSEYTFEVNEECINNGLTCVICKNIIIDAYQSECECQFCYKCIENYLKGENMKYCPGNKEICKEEHLELGRSVSRNPVLNRKVSHIEVICPNQSCLCQIELIKMEEHLRVCPKHTKLTCPYITIGCENEGGSKESILTHFHNNTFTHTKLLMEYIQNMKNEFGGLKNKFEMSKLEIASLKEESRMKETQMREQIHDFKKEIITIKEESRMKEIQMMEQIYDLKSQIIIIKEESIKKEIEHAERSLYTSEVMKKVMKEEREVEIITMRNELRLKEIKMKEERELEISSLRKESIMKEMEIRGIIENQNKEIELLKDEFKEMKNKVDLRLSLMAEYNEQRKNEIKREQRNEITELLDNKIKNEKENNEEVKKKNLKQEESKNIEENNKKIVKTEKNEEEIRKNHELQKERHNEVKEKWKSIIKSTKLYSNLNADFIWRIDDLIKKRQKNNNQYIFSESFYSNDYKLCLSVMFGGDNIYLYCCVMKGDNDDKVKWPLNKSLTVGIVDQRNSTTYKSITQHYSEYKYEKEAFNRPQSDKNEYYIIFNDDNIKNYSPLALYPPFIRHSSFMEEFIFNDFMIIFCVLSKY